MLCNCRRYRSDLFGTGISMTLFCQEPRRDSGHGRHCQNKQSQKHEYRTHANQHERYALI